MFVCTCVMRELKLTLHEGKLELLRDQGGLFMTCLFSGRRLQSTANFGTLQMSEPSRMA